MNIDGAPPNPLMNENRQHTPHQVTSIPFKVFERMQFANLSLSLRFRFANRQHERYDRANGGEPGAINYYPISRHFTILQYRPAP